jgi:YHS domain-containing protein
MVKKLSAILASAVLFAAVVANAAPDGAKKKAAATAPKCPVCKMALATTKSAKNPKAVKISGKTYYCCDKCPMDKKAAAHADTKKK